MHKNRTYLAILAVAASASLLAACSREDDASAPGTEPAPSGMVDPAPAPGGGMTPPPAPAPDSAPAPDAAPAPAPGDQSSNEPSLGERAAETAEQARDAVANAAAKADKAIQDSIGNGSQANNPPADGQQ